MLLHASEKQEIIRFLETNKPLPEKYRFLLFGDKREVELVWNGKTNEVTNVVLPFQTIEQVDEPRSEDDVKMQGSLFDLSGRQVKGWTNKLIWGDNKLILSSLKNGPLREEIEAQGGIKLIYIDPPFDVGADFSMNIEIGDEQFTKQPSVLEELAYRDTWGKGADSFIAMIYERLSLMRDLLAKDGSIYVHCDWRVNSYIRLVMDEVFGKDNFRNEIIWKRFNFHADAKKFGSVTDRILSYSKTSDFVFHSQVRAFSSEYIQSKFTHKNEDGRIFRLSDLNPPANRGPIYEFHGVTKAWRFTKEKMLKLESEGKIYSKSKIPQLIRYLDEIEGQVVHDMWDDISPVNPQAKERLDYPTQKPEALIERIIKASSNEGDLVADFFAGSGTTLAVAEKLGRKWIGSDLGKFGIHTTRKRMIGVQRQLKKEGKNYRAFEILNLGKYERQHFVGINADLREEEKQQQIKDREDNFLQLILTAYRAEPVEGFRAFHGKHAGRMVTVGPINLPITRLTVDEVIKECLEKHMTKVDILAFEFEMGLAPQAIDDAKAKGIDLALKYIPRDVFDKRAIEKNQVVFHDVSYIEVKPLVKKSSVAIELTDFCVYYNQDIKSEVEQKLKDGANKIIIENGTIIKISKDKNGIVSSEQLTKKWTDWIDYWSVDFNFESKKEIIRTKNKQGEWEEYWTGDYVFENEWQSFRTKKDRSLEHTSVFHEVEKGRRKIAVKVVDIFGNDTMKVVEMNI